MVVFQALVRRHEPPDHDDRHYLHVEWVIAGVASLAMLVGAWGLLHAESRTLQDTSIKLTALLGGGSPPPPSLTEQVERIARNDPDPRIRRQARFPRVARGD